MKNYILLIKAFKLQVPIGKACYWIAYAVAKSKRDKWESDVKDIISEGFNETQEQSKTWKLLEELRTSISEIMLKDEYFMEYK